MATRPYRADSRSFSAPIRSGPAICPMTAALNTITDEATARIRVSATLMATANTGP